MVRYICEEYFHRTLLSSRFLVILMMVPVLLTSLFWNMTSTMEKMGLSVGPLELLPCFLYMDGGIVLYFGVFVFLIAALPRWDGSLNQIPRLGKRKWLLSQYVNVFLTSIMNYLIWTLGFILAMLPRINWSGKWSNFIQKTIDPEQGFDFCAQLPMNVAMNFSEELVSVGSPVKIYLLTFLLQVLAGIFIGILMVTLNICFRCGTGTVVALLILGTRTFFEWIPRIFENKWLQFEGYKAVQNLLMRMEFYLSPTYQSDLYIMALHNTRPIAERLIIGITYFLLLTTLVVCFGLRMVRRIDLCQE